MRLSELQQALLQVDPGAVLVAPRVLARVIQQVHNLPSLTWVVPHAESYVVDRQVLFRHVDQDDLELRPDHLLPPSVILLARPSAEQLAAQDRVTLLGEYWRRLFHASIHQVLERQAAENRLSPEEVRARVGQIGQAEFTEVRKVLTEDHYLSPQADERAVYVEFAALFLELRFFAANLLPDYFPSLRDVPAVEKILTRDFSADALFARTRPAGAPDPVLITDHRSDESHDYYWKLMRAAERAAKAGNTVRAAIVRTRAARVAPAERTRSTRDLAEADIGRLTQRLEAALELNKAEVAEWSRDLAGLLDKADQGTRPVEADLLFDLQNACIDHEKDLYTLSVVDWLMSSGKRPIQRPLPSQRLVRVIKYLRSATDRLTMARLPEADRAHLGRLLQTALHQTEERLRVRFRPILASALQDVGLQPRNLPEQVAAQKLTEELLDRITANGYFTFSDLRDAISRNQLKLPDLVDPADFLAGDPLLRLDKRLAALLDGVYKPSEVYLRWLERMTALGFGNKVGRAITRWVTLPFGGALAVMEVLQYLLDHLRLRPPVFAPLSMLAPGRALATEHYPAAGIALGPPAVLLPERVSVPLAGLLWFTLVGLFLLALLHVAGFRRSVTRATVWTGRALHHLFITSPAWLLRRPWVRYLMAGWPFQLVYWCLLKPVLVCALLWLWVPQLFDSVAGVTVTYVAVVLLINSNPGRVVGEALGQGLIDLYELLRAGLVIGLLRLVVNVIKQVMQAVETVIFTVDEWLRFRSGNSQVLLVAQTVLGVLWFPISYVARFYLVVLIEPGVNPFKAPVSYLAAKFLTPLAWLWTDLIAARQATTTAKVLVWVFVFPTLWLLSDAFGFLFWEMKENWKLYRANRPPTLRPEAFGTHGETTRALLQPGFHSGTVPRLYHRLRNAERGVTGSANWRTARACRHGLEEVEKALRRFVTRNLVLLLQHSSAWRGQHLGVGRVDLACSRVRIELTHAAFAQQPVWLEWACAEGWLVAGICAEGWLNDLTPGQQRPLSTALASLYKLAGVDLVREQIRAAVATAGVDYDLTAEELVVWKDRRHGPAITYDLRDPNRFLKPRPLEGKGVADGPVLEAARLVFAQAPLTWKQWVECWQKDQDGAEHPPLFSGGVELTLLTPSGFDTRADTKILLREEGPPPRESLDALARETTLADGTPSTDQA